MEEVCGGLGETAVVSPIDPDVSGVHGLPDGISGVNLEAHEATLHAKLLVLLL